jgi:tellurite resistance protein
MTQTDSVTATALAQTESRLAHYPVTFFAIGMGMMGLALATHAATQAFSLNPVAERAVFAMAAVLLAGVSVGYLAKTFRYPGQVAAEWHHPVRIAFFPAIPISFLLLATSLLHVDKGLAEWVWLIATAAQGLLSLIVTGEWIGHRPFAPPQLSPAWFIPAVGNVVVPLAGVPLGYVELSWLFFAGGLVLWLVLLTLVMNRLVFHDPLPGRMVPTLMILVAPPAVAYIAWLRLTGEPGAFGHILLNAGYVFALIVVTQARRFRGIPFALSWWALSFPVAALSVASFAHAAATHSIAHQFIGAGLLALLAVIILFLLARTGLAIARHQICVPE